jgi:hypothetical protein
MAKHRMSVVIDLTFDDLGENNIQPPTPHKIEQGLKDLLQFNGSRIGFDFSYDHFEIVAAKGSLKQAFGVDE